MRIIGGKYKGKRIQPPRNFPSRPTTDMAKEALFNILDNRYNFEEMEVLDLFAGTGNISLEFLSRNAKHVLSVEKHPNVIRHLNQVLSSWEINNWSVLRKDVFRFLETTGSKFDLVFADPPFQQKETANLPDIIIASGVLKDGGIFILEHGQENSFDQHPHLAESRRYGGVFFSFFKTDN